MPFLRITTIFLLFPAAIFLGMTGIANAQSTGTPGIQSGSRAGLMTANCSTSAAQNCTVGKMRARGAAASSPNAVKPEAQDLETASIVVNPNVKTVLAGVVEIDTTTCAFISSGSWQVTTPPKYGTVQTAIVNEMGPSCTGYTYPFNFIYYTWTSTDPAATTDTFSATWSGDSQTTPEPFTFDFTLACPTPTVTSVSPNVWFAGQTYSNVTITGTGFTPVFRGFGPPPCPVSTATVTTPSGAAVALGAVTVNSSTQITIASVKPPVLEASETATVTVSGSPKATYPTQIENPQPSIKTLEFTNSLPVWLDGPSNATPVAMSQTVWPASTPSVRSVFVSGTSINATATFNVTPITVALSGARIEANVSGVGLMFAPNVSIPAGSTSVSVTLSSEALPDSQTQHYQPLEETWSFSPSGQACSSGTSVCEPAGATSSEVYVTLATPLPMSESVMPLSAVELAIGSGGATSPTQALENTWQQFAGPANVNGWDGRPLYYYEQGVGFHGCATSSVGLLTSSTGSGQCGSWANLLMDALAVNGITSSFIQIQPTDQSSMLINNWAFKTVSNLYPAPYDWNLTLPFESGAGPGMVPLSSVSGGVTSETGLAGQNSPTPSEKFFTRHFIVQAPSGSSGGYYDPSYGVQYTGPCGGAGSGSFESMSIAGYALPAQAYTSNDPIWNFGVRQPVLASCNITFTNLGTN
jgi:hypothetical protein